MSLLTEDEVRWLTRSPSTANGYRRPQRSRDGMVWLGIATIVVLVLAAVVFWVQTNRDVSVDLVGFEGEASVRPIGEFDSLVTLRVEPAGQADSLVVLVDGERVDTRTPPDQPTLKEVVPGPLEEGPHLVTASVDRPFYGEVTRSFEVMVDGTAPPLELPKVDPVAIDEPVTVRGRTEPGATISFAGTNVMGPPPVVESRLRRSSEPTTTTTQPDIEVAPTVVPEVTVADDGAFTLEFPVPPAAPVEVIATDTAGNATSAELIVAVAYPGGRGVHVSGSGWQDAAVRATVLEAIRQGRIDTVELDLKGEAGWVEYDTQVPLAHELGTVAGSYDLEAATEEIHSHGARVIGRLVAFRDPLLAAAAWARGDEDWVIQAPDGGPLDVYGGFANFVHPAVRQYNLDIAVEAADAGVDEILWDYIRRPEGDPETMVIPGRVDPSSAYIASFLAEGHELLRERGVYQGASVFGIAASRPDAIAQNIPAIARHTDYVSPMVYPALWNDGEYDVEKPNQQPYDIVKASLADFQEVMADTGKPLVPWLQDFSLGVDYGEPEVRAQIDAAASIGIDSFLLWDPNFEYSWTALDPVAS